MPTTKVAATKPNKAGVNKETATAGTRKSPARSAAATTQPDKNATSSRTVKKSTGTAGKSAAKKTSAKTAATKNAAPAKKKPAAQKRTAGKSTVATGRSGTSSTSSPKSSVRRSRSSRVKVLTGPVRGIEPYRPTRGEAYMNEVQLAHFRKILLAWKRELMEEVDRTMHHMKDDAANFPDPNDRATQESEFGLELRTRDRDRKLLKKIDSALARIDDGSYGYCEETGEEIGLRRLEARPVATLCVEAQERRELAERQFRDREDYYR